MEVTELSEDDVLHADPVGVKGGDLGSPILIGSGEKGSERISMEHRRNMGENMNS